MVIIYTFPAINGKAYGQKKLHSAVFGQTSMIGRAPSGRAIWLYLSGRAAILFQSVSTTRPERILPPIPRAAHIYILHPGESSSVACATARRREGMQPITSLEATGGNGIPMVFGQKPTPFRILTVKKACIQPFINNISAAHTRVADVLLRRKV